MIGRVTAVGCTGASQPKYMTITTAINKPHKIIRNFPLRNEVGFTGLVNQAREISRIDL